MKGQETLPITQIVAFFISVVILGIILNSTSLLNNFVKEETLDIKTDRVGNTVLGMQSVEEGFIELSIEGYSIKIDGLNVSMNYSGSNYTTQLNSSMIKTNLNGPSKYKEINGSLCINKTAKKTEVTPGNC